MYFSVQRLFGPWASINKPCGGAKTGFRRRFDGGSTARPGFVKPQKEETPGPQAPEPHRLFHGGAPAAVHTGIDVKGAVLSNHAPTSSAASVGHPWACQAPESASSCVGVAHASGEYPSVFATPSPYSLDSSPVALPTCGLGRCVSSFNRDRPIFAETTLADANHVPH